MMKQIYLDHASTTPVRAEVLEAMLPHFSEEYGNPYSIYPLGQTASDAVAEAREVLAGIIGATPREVFFTSGGTEADNWAIKGFAHANSAKGKHLITSSIEHHAVLHTCEALEREGFEVTYLPVDEHGLVRPEDLKAALRPHTILVSIMFANNEIGTIQPIHELAAIAHEHGAVFHTDAVQAFGHELIDVNELGIDMLSASAHKIYGPKGAGMLYVRKGVKLANLLDGGQQERGKRATTENVPGIVGFAKAAELAAADLAPEHDRQLALRDHAIKRVLAEIPHAKLNGSWEDRLANNVNFSFEFIEGEGMLLQLAARGICVSSGSACTSGSLDPSHVLLAIGLPHEIAHGSLRLTIGRSTTQEDVDFAIDSLATTLENLRMMSPLYEDFKQGKVDSASRSSQLTASPTRTSTSREPEGTVLLATFGHETRARAEVAKRTVPSGSDTPTRKRATIMAMNYSEKVMDHFTNPRNVGEIEDASGCGTVGNAVCGDIMRVYLDIDDDGVIRDAKFKTFGCGAAIATSSMATVLVKGKTVQEALEVTNKAVMEALDGLPQVKVHCSLLVEEAIHAALWDYAEKNGIEIEGLEKPVSDISEHDHAHGAEDEDD